VRRIAIINQKGGCGKTTTAINLAGVLARRGKRTLLVDMDPQSHCAAGLAIPEQRIDVHIGDAMVAVGDNPDKAIDWTRLLWRVSRNLDLAPSTVRLAGLESARGGLGTVDAEQRLDMVLTRVADQYDVCLIDCPPSIGLLTFNALAACQEVLIPVETGFFALQGTSKQVATIKSLAKRLGVAATYRMVATLHDGTSTLQLDVLHELQERFAELVVPVVVRLDAKLREGVRFGQPAIEYAPESTGAEDYGNLADWLLAHPPKVARKAGESTALPSAPAPAHEIDRVASHDYAEAEPSVASPTVPVAPVVYELSGSAGSLPGLHAAVEASVASLSKQVKVLAESVRDALNAQTGRGPTPVSSSSSSSLSPSGAPNGSGDAGTMGVGSSSAGLAALTTALGGAPAALAHPGITDAATISAALSSAVAPATSLGVLQGTQVYLVDEPASWPSSASTAQGAAPVSGISSPHGARASRVAGEVACLLGARPTNQGVLFVQPLSVGSRICVAGDFNGWSPSATPMRRNEELGVFELTLPLPPGKSQYRMVIDGRWTGDAYNPNVEVNPFGEPNSYVVVPASARAGRSEGVPGSMPGVTSAAASAASSAHRQ
jgi:chromosome partitioning protein